MRAAGCGRRTHLARVDALARRGDRRLVLRLEDDVDDLEDGAVAHLVRHDAAVLRVALREQPRPARLHHARLLRRAEHGGALLLLLLLKLALELLLDPRRLGRHGGCDESVGKATRQRGAG